MTLEEEEEVDWLLSMVERLQDANDRLSDVIEAERDQRESAIRREQEARAQEAAQVRDDVRKLAIGDLRSQAIGVLLFWFGAALQAWPQEIARHLWGTQLSGLI